MNCDGESQSCEHTAGIGFYLLIDKVSDIGKSDDFLRLFFDDLFL